MLPVSPASSLAPSYGSVWLGTKARLLQEDNDLRPTGQGHLVTAELNAPLMFTWSSQSRLLYFQILVLPQTPV